MKLATSCPIQAPWLEMQATFWKHLSYKAVEGARRHGGSLLITGTFGEADIFDSLTSALPEYLRSLVVVDAKRALRAVASTEEHIRMEATSPRFDKVVQVSIHPLRAIANMAAMNDWTDQEKILPSTPYAQELLA